MDFKEKHTFVAKAFISPFNTQAMCTKSRMHNRIAIFP
jgi:hypothetical protein